MRITLLIVVTLLSTPTILSQQGMPGKVVREIERSFPSWKLAEIEQSIVNYFAEKRSYEKPNFIRGDWNGDGKSDYAVMLERRLNSEDRILLVLIRKGRSFEHHFLPANDCIMSVKKGSKGYDWEAERRFTYRNDAIFSYYWEKAGSSYVWDRGRFRSVLTSD